MTPHTELTLQAATVAASAIRAVESVRSVLGPSNGEVSGFRGVLQALQALYAPQLDPPPRRRRAARPHKPPPPKSPLPESSRLREAIRRRRLPQAVVEEEFSEWDPDPLYEARRCQALLLEVIKRAIHDWVLYRQHRSLEKKALAQHAYEWLFREEPGHRSWRERETAVFVVRDDEGLSRLEAGSRRLTSFVSICEIVGIDPDAVRARAREMTIESISRTGRHTERRRSNSESASIESHSVVVDIDLDALDPESHDHSSYGYSSSHDW